MNLKSLIKFLKIRLNEQGEKLDPENENFGPATEESLSKYDIEISLKKKANPPPPTGRVENPSYLEAKKYEGKKETDKAFGAWLSGYWKKTGLNYKTIIGSSFAWCALFVVAVQSDTGQKYIASASAKAQAKTGIEINFKEDGIPRGAIIHLNHGFNCSSASGNHVTFADGDCTAADLKKPGATFPGFGGNQSNQVKRSNYDAREICAVRWPAEVPKPPKIEKSVNCQGSKDSGESTR